MKEIALSLVHQVELFSKQNLELLNNFLKLFLNHPKHTRF
jgi:hypothetical protein